MWEGIRLHHETLTAEVWRLLRANDMHDGVHIRLMVTRGVKKTPSQDPRLTQSGATIAIIAGHKLANPATAERGVRLFTSTIQSAPYLLSKNRDAA